MQAVNAGARLDRLPISRFHYRNIGLVAGGMFLDGFEINLQGVVLAAVLASGWSTPAQNALFISATFGGMVLGAWLAGIVGDRYGRRFSYQINLLVFGLASFAAALAPSMEWLTTARFAMGVGLGAEIVVGYVTVLELVPPASRGRWGAALAATTNLSVFVSALIGRLVIPDYGWQPLFACVGAGALLVWALRKSMPESPRWLEAKGRLAEAEAVMHSIEIEVEAGGHRPLPAPAVQVQALPVSAMTSAHLFSAGILWRTVTGCLLLVGVNCTIYGFIAFLPSFMIQQGMSIAKSLTYVTVMSLGGPVGALVGVALADRIGRKPCLIGFSVAAIAFGLSYPHAVDPTVTIAAGFCLVTSVYVLVAVGFSLYVPELFPTEIRMRGAGLCNAIGRLALIGMPYLTTALFAAGGVNLVIVFVTGLLTAMVAVIAVFGPETKQRPLEALSGQALGGLAGYAVEPGPSHSRQLVIEE